MADYFPKDEPSLLIWLGNHQAKLANHVATLGLAPAELTALSTACADVSTFINNVESAKSALKNALEAKNVGKDSNITLIWKANNKMKTSDAYTDANGEDMEIKSGIEGIDREAATPKFSSEAFPGYLCLKFSKKWPGWCQQLFEDERTGQLEFPGP
jgi:hypothetical protein